MKHVIPVIFRLEHGSDPDVIAFFPTIPSTRNFGSCTTYAHFGQHSGACIQYYQRTKKATPEQYKSLYVELKEIYEDETTELKVVQRWLQKYDNTRADEIIKLIGKE